MIVGTDWRLSKAAFGDLCHFAGVPSAFIRRFAQIDEAQALDVMETLINRVFHGGQGKSLVIDSRTGIVDGIVGAETYAHIPNQDALSYLLTAAPGLVMTQGWLTGPNMRAVAVTKDKPVEAKKGDIVHFGVNLENAIHGDRSLKVNSYFERLVCENGATCTEREGTVAVIHRGDIAFNTQSAVVKVAAQSEEMIELVQSAPHYLMLDKDIRSMRSFLRDTAQGGNQTLDTTVTKEAQNEAAKENRPPEETTLWNWHNAITAHAKTAPSVNRRVELEAIGYKALVRFGAVLAN